MARTTYGKQDFFITGHLSKIYNTSKFKDKKFE